MKRSMTLLFAILLAQISFPQETNNWWESFNNTNKQTSNNSERSFFATKVQLGLNIDYLNGPGSDGFDPGVGYNIGLSEDFWNNKNLGIEVGFYYTQYGLSFGTSNDHHFNTKLKFLEWQFLFNPRLFIDKNAVELNLGMGLDWGLSAPVKYKSESLGYDMFGEKGVLKDSSTCLLYGLTWRWSDGYIRFLIHDGITNISKVESEKVNLWNAEFSIGCIF